jgi:hypothetical protein
MTNIGWVESSAGDKVDKIREAVARVHDKKSELAKGYILNTTTGSATFPGPTTTSSTNGYGYTINITMPTATTPEDVAKQVQKTINKTLEGGVDTMETEKKEEVVETTATTTEETTTDQPTAESVEEVTPTEEAPADENTDTAAAVEEVEAEEVDLAKMFGEFAARIEGVVTTSKNETAEVVKAVQTEVAAKVDGLEAKVSELETKFSTLQENVAKRVDAVEGDTAFKKSADLGGSTEKIEKTESIWGGRFLGANVSDITR